MATREDDFKALTGQEPAVDNTNTYRNISHDDIYRFMDNAYHGTGGFRDGTYLIPHTREMFYEQRKRSAYYKNFVKPILRAMIEPVFNDPVVRSITDDNDNPIDGTLFNEFILNADNAGRTLQMLTQDAVRKARLHGVSFIVMDNFEAEEQPPTLSEARQERVFPYAYIRQADSVESYQMDKWGNLTSIMFREQPEKVVLKDGEMHEEERWRVWDTNEVIVYKKEEDKYLNNDTKPKWVEVSRHYHGLGRVPVISLYAISREDYDGILVDPPLYDIAKLNYAIYNSDSEIRDLERSQGFTIFYIQADNSGKAVTVGPRNLLIIPTDSNIPPGTLAPDPGVLSGLVENNSKMVEHLYRLAEQNGVVGVENASSGIAKSYDFYALEGVLKHTASMAVWLEDQIADLFKLYTSEVFNFQADYPHDFQPQSVGDEISTYVEAYEKIAKSPKFKKKLEEKTAKMLLADEDGEVVAEIVEDIQSYEPPMVAPVGVTGIGGV